ncbi:chemotaxis response regulator protein-glutamate methylesterase [Acidihalobacter yilgarnensis]|uniref:Protein-glutamate methylesterase/protein-glutamine glutaminase n=1 Tax=Acidihalobacter yilgarnensis TaxID=2819280 RepID=A0A1D8IPQ4_9GAMM|nr:chemotaxis response regulator protein-glutamate methylesterase [Acidihalobacter yilgarnensis]AOU98452.1 chemotaxis response regulator protein-glutamate methylesterase [Acidihalobacter yilgarnensis]
MKVRVLVVDDSAFFRRAVRGMLESDPDIEVVAVATNGREAVACVAEHKPDIVTMDIEMPVMDGITAARHIMSSHPRPILMFSSLTHEGAKATLDALDAGAADFLPKQFEEIARDRSEVGRVLCQRVKALARRRSAPVAPPAGTAFGRPAARAPMPISRVGAKLPQCRLVLIGTSTGGPVALQKVLMALPANFSRPLLLVQHMPAAFTPAFAERLNGLCAIEVQEAKDQTTLRPGVALLAPGGMQMILEGSPGAMRVRIGESPPELHYRPSVDVTFSSAERINPGGNLGIILTGMGADGREGARLMKRNGSTIWSQDQASSTVYGMPAAVAEAGLTDRVLALDECGKALVGAF